MACAKADSKSCLTKSSGFCQEALDLKVEYRLLELWEQPEDYKIGEEYWIWM